MALSSSSSSAPAKGVVVTVPVLVLSVSAAAIFLFFLLSSLSSSPSTCTCPVPTATTSTTTAAGAEAYGRFGERISPTAEDVKWVKDQIEANGLRMQDNVLRKGINPRTRAQQLQDLVQFVTSLSLSDNSGVRSSFCAPRPIPPPTCSVPIKARALLWMTGPKGVGST